MMPHPGYTASKDGGYVDVRIALVGMPPATLRFCMVIGMDGPAASGANVATSEPNKGTAHVIYWLRVSTQVGPTSKLLTS
jgi:hypothetical protein